MAALISLAAIVTYLWQEGIHTCQDGKRYTSSKLQPTPFNRRVCNWSPRSLAVLTWLSFATLATQFGTWQQAALFVTLPGVWFCVTRPTTVDGPAMMMAWGAATLMHSHPWLALLIACAAGGIHERAPVFAAVYAWHPLMLVGLVVPLLIGLRGAAEPDHESPDLADRLVGHGTWGALKAHRPHVDLLNDTGLVWSLRGLVPLAAWQGAEPRAWVALALAFASRAIGTDTARFMLWAAPPLIAGLAHAPAWAVALHVITFRRVMR